MSEGISAKEVCLYDLMAKDYIFNIPEYQRPYSWTDTEAQTLWSDLVSFWEYYNENKNQTYFMGSIVLVEKPDSVVEVIDGQQRITTLSMLLAVLYRYCNTIRKDIRKCLWEEGVAYKGIEGRPRLALRRIDAEFFKNYIVQMIDSDSKEAELKLLDLDPAQLKDDAQRLMQDNTRQFTKLAEAQFGNDNSADDFLKVLLANCYFVVVTTPNNDTAFRVFSVLNDRGLSLLPSDIIKAKIIGEIAESKRENYAERWEEIEIDLGREAFNALLSHIRSIYARNKLHGTLVAEFEKYVFPTISSKEKLITDVIEPYARLYAQIINCEYVASYGAEEINTYLYWLNKIDATNWIPPLMLAMKISNGNTDGYITKFTRLLDRISSFFYITSHTVNKRIERFALVMEYLLLGNKDAACDYLQLTKEEQKQFLGVLNDEVYNMPSRKRTYVVQRLDSFISDGAATYQSKVFTIEHVLPQNPAPESQWLKNWNEEERRYWTHRVGNLIPLSRKKNSQAQNFEFSKKKAQYFSNKNGVSSYALATDVIKECVWTPEVVEKRQTILIACFAKGWKLETEKEYSEDTDIILKQGREKVYRELEKQKQDKYIADLEQFFAENPETKIPYLERYNGVIGAGVYIKKAMHKLFISNYIFTESQLAYLCNGEKCRIYTHRRDIGMLHKEPHKRCWRDGEFINGAKYYVFSQWYPDKTKPSNSHVSDFYKFYLDLATGKIN